MDTAAPFRNRCRAGHLSGPAPVVARTLRVLLGVGRRASTHIERNGMAL